MKHFAIAFLAIAVVYGVPVQDKTLKCIPGTLVKQDCNDCICSADGSALACTLMLCPPPTTAKDTRERREVEALTTTEVCQPGETKQVDCNTCYCSGNGQSWGCTYKACDTQVCEPGSSYKKFCNTCACSADGTSEVCTRKACPKNVYNEDGTLVNPSLFEKSE